MPYYTTDLLYSIYRIPCYVIDRVSYQDIFATFLKGTKPDSHWYSSRKAKWGSYSY